MKEFPHLSVTSQTMFVGALLNLKLIRFFQHYLKKLGVERGFFPPWDGWPDWANFRLLGDYFRQSFESYRSSQIFGLLLSTVKGMYLCVNVDKKWTGLHLGDFSQTHLVTLPSTFTYIHTFTKKATILNREYILICLIQIIFSVSFLVQLI
jgi:hypothetical protein